MATFLTNSKMDAALVGRIEASLRGGTRSRTVRSRPGRVAATRFLIVLTLLLGLVFMALSLREQQIEFSGARVRLLQDIERETAKVPGAGWKLLPAITKAIGQAAGVPAPDFIAPELRDPPLLQALLARPTLYVRGDVVDVTSLPHLERAAADSTNDAFIACLVEPPTSSEEEPLLQKVRAVYRGDVFQGGQLSNFHRLFDLFYALNFLGPAWVDRVKNARDAIEVAELQHKFETAQVERMLPATQAEVLIFLLDEPKKLGTVSELDGAHDHLVRVGILELKSQTGTVQSRTLLSARKRLNPSWISDKVRPRFATGLDACRLAVDLRNELISPAAAPVESGSAGAAAE